MGTVLGRGLGSRVMLPTLSLRVQVTNHRIAGPIAMALHILFGLLMLWILAGLRSMHEDEGPASISDESHRRRRQFADGIHLTVGYTNPNHPMRCREAASNNTWPAGALHESDATGHSSSSDPNDLSNASVPSPPL